MINSNSSAGTEDAISTNVEATSVRQTIAKPIVGSSAFLSREITHISADFPLSKDTGKMINKIVKQVNKLKL